MNISQKIGNFIMEAELLDEYHWHLTIYDENGKLKYRHLFNKLEFEKFLKFIVLVAIEVLKN